MSTKKGRRLCIFCGQPGVTREHVWPRWLRSIFEDSDRVTHEVWSERPERPSVNRTWTNKPISTTARIVCKACNGGWMGSLEAENSGLLGAMIRGVPQSLTEEEQERITLWCIKTGLMLDRVSMPNDHPRLLFATRRPMDYSAIWLTSCNDQTVAMSHTIKRLAPELRLLPEAAPSDEALLFSGTGRFEGYLQTIRIGAFASQILWSDSRDAVESVTGWPDSLHHARIWPTEDVAVPWPQTIIPTPADLDRFATRIPPPADHFPTSI
jgi:hypothetical protein